MKTTQSGDTGDERAERQELANVIRRGWVQRSNEREPKVKNITPRKIRSEADRNWDAWDAIDAETSPWGRLNGNWQAIHNRLMRTTPGTVEAVEAARAYRKHIEGATDG